MKNVDVAAVKIMHDTIVFVKFSDKLIRIIDLKPFMIGRVFDPYRTPEGFKQLFVDPDIGTIAWPNGADIDPYILYTHKR